MERTTVRHRAAVRRPPPLSAPLLAKAEDAKEQLPSNVQRSLTLTPSIYRPPPSRADVALPLLSKTGSVSFELLLQRVCFAHGAAAPALRLDVRESFCVRLKSLAMATLILAARLRTDDLFRPILAAISPSLKPNAASERSASSSAADQGRGDGFIRSDPAQ